MDIPTGCLTGLGPSQLLPRQQCLPLIRITYLSENVASCKGAGHFKDPQAVQFRDTQDLPPSYSV